MRPPHFPKPNLINVGMFLGLPVFAVGFLFSNQQLLYQNKPSLPATINTELPHPIDPPIQNPINPEFDKPLIQASTPSVNIQLPSDIDYRLIPSINGRYHGKLSAGTEAAVTDDRRISQGFLEVEVLIDAKLQKVWIHIPQN